MSDPRTCRSCAETKPLSEFYRGSRDRWFTECKHCVSAARRRRYDAEPAVLKARVSRRAKTTEGIFETQRNNAAARGIEWRLTFSQWWAIWQESGKWAQRGLRRGQYVMARLGDRGPYAIGNVKIITTEANIAERYAHSSSIKNLPEKRSTNGYEFPTLFRGYS